MVLLDVWRIKDIKGEPVGTEGLIIRWVLPQEFNQFQFPEANSVIIRKLLSK